MNLPNLYHVSNKRFGRVDIKTARETLINVLLTNPEQNKSPNGTLGFWISPFPEYCSGFGPEVAKVHLSENAVFIKMDVRQLRKGFWKPVMDIPDVDVAMAHARLGEELAKLGDVLFITDGTEEAGEIIVLNDQVVTQLNWDCGIDLKSHQGESVYLDRISFDEEASKQISYWRFDETGNLDKSASQPCRRRLV